MRAMYLDAALFSLYSNCTWEFYGEEYSGLIWKDDIVPKPTENELRTELSRLQAEYDAKQYQRDRAPEYPSLADLADAMYWASKGDNTKLDNYYAACEAVKLKYPKS